MRRERSARACGIVGMPVASTQHHAGVRLQSVVSIRRSSADHLMWSATYPHDVVEAGTACHDQLGLEKVGRFQSTETVARTADLCCIRGSCGDRRLAHPVTECINSATTGLVCDGDSNADLCNYRYDATAAHRTSSEHENVPGAAAAERTAAAGVGSGRTHPADPAPRPPTHARLVHSTFCLFLSAPLAVT